MAVVFLKLSETCCVVSQMLCFNPLVALGMSLKFKAVFLDFPSMRHYIVIVQEVRRKDYF